MNHLIERFNAALALAAIAHQGQIRKGTENAAGLSLPYITHPVAVAALVQRYGGGEDQIIAALLHDVLEDGGPAWAGPIQVDFGAEVLALVAGRLSIFCELKATPGDAAQDAALVEGVIAAIEAANARDWCGIHSFNPVIVERARAVQPRLSAAIISGPVDGDGALRLFGAVLKRGAQAISLYHSSIDAALVRVAKQRQLTVWTWTVDDEADWERVVAAGVDGIITNVPHRLREHLAR